MKKLSVAIIALAGCYAGASIYSGIQAENTTRDYFATHAAQLEQQGVSISLTEYSRHLFSSRSVARIELTQLRELLPDAALIVTSDIQHGPLLTKGGFGVGAVAMESTYTINGMSLNAGTTHAVLNYSGTIAAHHVIPAQTIPLGNNQLVIKPISIDAEGDEHKGTYTVSQEPIEIHQGGGVLASLSAATLKGEYRHIGDGIVLQDVVYDLPSTTVNSPTGEMTFNGTHLSYRNDEKSHLIDSTLTLSVTSIESAMGRLGDYTLTLATNNVPVSFVKQVNALSKIDIEKDDAEHTMMTIIRDGVNDLSSNKAELRGNLDMNIMGAPASVKLNADLTGGDINTIDFANAETFEFYDLLDLVNGHFHITLSHELIQATPVGFLLMGQLDNFEEKESTYELHALIKDGVLDIHGEKTVLKSLYAEETLVAESEEDNLTDHDHGHHDHEH